MIADLRALLALRLRVVTQARLRRVAAALVASVVLVAVVGSALWARNLPGSRAAEVRLLLPSLFLGFLVTAVLAAVTSGGGREVLPREQALAFPVSPEVDYLGALVLAPVNLAWLLQGLTLLALTAYAVPTTSSAVAGMATVVMWQLTSTVVAQAVSGATEWVRSLEGGRWLLRALGGAVGGIGVWVGATGRLANLADTAPSRRWGLSALYGHSGTWALWALRLAELVIVASVTFWLGLLLARALARRPRPEESRAETRREHRHPESASDLRALVRVDWASVWRAVPLRRGVLVLGALPAAVAGIGRVPWETMTVLPALVASGAALLFGVNAWCLDGPGAWWRESQPVAARTMLGARGLVLLLTIITPLLVTLTIATMRAPTRPSSAQVIVLLLSTIVVCTHVVSRCLWWSVTRPFGADLRSARATPAPPVSMAGYSARLAVVTTTIGIAFGACGAYARIDLALLVATASGALSMRRLVKARVRWDLPDTRASIMTIVARAG